MSVQILRNFYNLILIFLCYFPVSVNPSFVYDIYDEFWNKIGKKFEVILFVSTYVLYQSQLQFTAQGQSYYTQSNELLRHFGGYTSDKNFV